MVRTPTGIFLTQQNYVHDLIHKFHMHNTKPVRTPSLYRTSLTLIDVDSIKYRSMVGALQYLTMTRSDIAYAVHVVYQCMHAPVLISCTLSSAFSDIYRVVWVMACSVTLPSLHLSL